MTLGEEQDVATTATGTDRWKALDFAPPAADAEEPDSPVLVDYRHGDQVAVITLNRPHADNAITTEMGARLTEIVETIAVRTAVRVVVLTGAGERAFSVGSDLRQRKNMTKEDWLRQRQDFDRTLYTVRQLRKPIFAAVNGIAYGGGCELAQSCDFIIASETATFGQPEAMLGLAAGGGSPVFLPRLLPPGKALQMLMTGDPITAQEAHRLGMVNELHAPARADGRGEADRGEDREQLADRGPSRQTGRAPRRGTADRAGDRDHDGSALALGRASRPRRRHRRLQRRPRPGLPRRRLLIRTDEETETWQSTDDLAGARAALQMINPAPYNAEAPPEALAGEITPTEFHYVRSNFALPTHDGTLEVGGAVDNPLTLTLDDLRAMPAHERAVTLECAGNGRLEMRPLPTGEPWGDYAVSTARWKGARSTRCSTQARPGGRRRRRALRGRRPRRLPPQPGARGHRQGRPDASSAPCRSHTPPIRPRRS